MLRSRFSETRFPRPSSGPDSGNRPRRRGPRVPAAAGGGRPSPATGCRPTRSRLAHGHRRTDGTVSGRGAAWPAPAPNRGAAHGLPECPGGALCPRSGSASLCQLPLTCAWADWGPATAGAAVALGRLVTSQRKRGRTTSHRGSLHAYCVPDPALDNRTRREQDRPSETRVLVGETRAR